MQRRHRNAMPIGNGRCFHRSPFVRKLRRPVLRKLDRQRREQTERFQKTLLFLRAKIKRHARSADIR